jgi:hypothetical protein
VITDDLTADLSHIADSFVIARNTAFTYKGKPVDAKQIGKDLGVRYLLEGSVQRVGEKITISIRGNGVGALNIGAKGTLEFGSSVDRSHTVDFTASGGALELGEAERFGATIEGVSGTADIDLLGRTITKLSYSGSSAAGVLTVTGSGGGTIAELSFTGDYLRSNFAFCGDQISFATSHLGSAHHFPGG